MEEPLLPVAIELASMVQLAEARAPNDDWTGTISRAERRRRQNRLNQRARRRRKAEEATQSICRRSAIYQRPPPSDTSRSSSSPIMGPGAFEWHPPTPPPIRPALDDPHDLLSAFSPNQLVRLASQSVVPLGRHAKLVNSKLARWFERITELLTKALYPLSADPLLTLTSYNVVRGLVVNLIILGAETPAYCETIHSLKLQPGQNLPPCLMPTRLQGRMHPAWIDLFPAPKVRDNFIERLGQFDEVALCDEIMGEVCFGGAADDRIPMASLVPEDLHVDSGRPGLILWSDPWDIHGWEVTPSFLRKWAWALVGCPEIIESTNRWRAMRDEAPLSYSDVICQAVEG